MPEPLPNLAGTPASGTVPVAAPAGAAPTGTRRLPRLDRREIAAIFAGGALGTLLRAALAEAFPQSPTAWGFHGDHAPHGDRLLQLGRHVPAITIVIDTPERVSAAFSVIDELTGERGLVTSETIPAMRASAGAGEHGSPPTISVRSRRLGNTGQARGH